MYNSFQLTKKFFHYYLTASNGKGHGIHSPFVFEFITNILNDKKQYDCYDKIEVRRKILRKDPQEITVEDFGAGSAVIKANKRKVAAIAASSLKPKKFAQLLFRMVNYYRPQTIVELGTSFGITTAYLASANAGAKIFTFEGATAIAGIAQQNFNELGLKNIELVTGDFTQTLPSALSRLNEVDLAFIDGNHRKVHTLDYFYQLTNHSSPSTILVFDDIHWSKEMEEAWEQVKHAPGVTLTIDLFFTGIVFFNTDIKIPQHFRIRF